MLTRAVHLPAGVRRWPPAVRICDPVHWVETFFSLQARSMLITEVSAPVSISAVTSSSSTVTVMLDVTTFGTASGYVGVSLSCRRCRRNGGSSVQSASAASPPKVAELSFPDLQDWVSGVLKRRVKRLGLGTYNEQETMNGVHAVVVRHYDDSR